MPHKDYDKVENKEAILPFDNSINQDEKGRWKPGNKAGGQGDQSYHKWRSQMIAEFRKCVSRADVAKLVKMIKKKAFEGDMRAIELLVERILGKETQVIEVDKKEVQWQYKYDLAGYKEIESNPDNIKKIESIVSDIVLPTQPLPLPLPPTEAKVECHNP